MVRARFRVGGSVSVFSRRRETLWPSADVGQDEMAGRGRSKGPSRTGLARVGGMFGWPDGRAVAGWPSGRKRYRSQSRPATPFLTAVPETHSPTQYSSVIQSKTSPNSCPKDQRVLPSAQVQPARALTPDIGWPMVNHQPCPPAIRSDDRVSITLVSRSGALTTPFGGFGLRVPGMWATRGGVGLSWAAGTRLRDVSPLAGGSGIASLYLNQGGIYRILIRIHAGFILALV